MGHTQNQKHYFCGLEAIRGLATLFIVLRHTVNFWGNFSFYESYLAVDAFFCISGVVVANAYEQSLLTNKMGAAKFVWVRFIRLYPLYFLGLALGLLAVLWGETGRQDASFLSIILGVGVLPTLDVSSPKGIFPYNGAEWFVFFVFWSNVFYAVFIRHLCNKNTKIIVATSAAGLLGVCLALHHNLDVGFTTKGFPLGFLRAGFSFFTGVLLFRYYEQRPEKRACPMGNWFMVGVLAVFFMVWAASPSLDVVPYFDFISVVFLTPFLVFFSLHLNVNGMSARLYKFVGGISYAIYVVHGPLSNLIKNKFQQSIAIDVQSYAPVSGLLLLAFLFVAGWGLSKAYDAPIRNCLLRIKVVPFPKA